MALCRGCFRGFKVEGVGELAVPCPVASVGRQRLTPAGPGASPPPRQRKRREAVQGRRAGRCLRPEPQAAVCALLGRAGDDTTTTTTAITTTAAVAGPIIAAAQRESRRPWQAGGRGGLFFCSGVPPRRKWACHGVPKGAWPIAPRAQLLLWAMSECTLSPSGEIEIATCKFSGLNSTRALPRNHSPHHRHPPRGAAVPVSSNGSGADGVRGADVPWVCVLWSSHWSRAEIPPGTARSPPSRDAPSASMGNCCCAASAARAGDRTESAWLSLRGRCADSGPGDDDGSRGHDESQGGHSRGNGRAPLLPGLAPNTQPMARRRRGCPCRMTLWDKMVANNGRCASERRAQGNTHTSTPISCRDTYSVAYILCTMYRGAVEASVRRGAEPGLRVYGSCPLCTIIWSSPKWQFALAKARAAGSCHLTAAARLADLPKRP
ncbi:hypothetical protein K505DRAFT_397787 [Melanomma pulvis-pyrius CBS 109.77]|uniref:Uncharacterized protein n=1 Tax=Melanomma pulvis-pyrius CBS 109.77 TaxID=1314802 RepID=A0A6A6XNV2_9PLEO|nr:hypothetical protein K505DRAFT_397787 [Melanomma pulvis-pyrius CBS 109.77]